MSDFIVSARKYRPETFKSVVGQDSITSTLKNAISNKHLGHAYLFTGPRGVGKTTCARIFAKATNCQNISADGEACNECESCVSFNESRSYNIHELDAASNNSVDDIRSLNDQVRIPPQLGKYSIYIIDEVHMLSSAAFNAFLKTLEEPPKHAIFILATTEKHKIIPTILSRCQIFDFNRIKVPDAVKYLSYIAKEESIEYEPEAFHVIAQKADGAMRDALSIFDQVVSFSGGSIKYQTVIENLNILDFEYYFKLTNFFLEGNTSQPLLIFDDILNRGFDPHNFINGLATHFRELLVSTDTQTIQLLEVSDNLKEKYLTQAKKVSPDFLFALLDICSQIDLQYKGSRNQRLLIELGLIKMANVVAEKKKHLTEQSQDKPDEKESISVPEKESQNEPILIEKKEAVLPENPVPTLAAKTTESKTESREKSDPEIQIKRNLVKAPVISIKDALQKKATINEKHTESVEELQDVPEIIEDESLPNEIFSKEDLLKSWDVFVEQIKEDKPRIYSTLKEKDLSITKEFLIEIEFDNLDQLENFNHQIKQQLINHLRSDLSNSSIDIITRLKDRDDTGRRLYTVEERFKYLAEKNPSLVKLKQKFNLDFD
ncbi:MAG: DNA polymerase III subunit gamma/tau [Bacteroidales bacterium]|nr:DNA polymerase III subunit gamma/tau [Bacteroidales bacterium]MCF8389532.1 DNA polymerase III subunit gamma/tau [Bacteroidales bacterium]